MQFLYFHGSVVIQKYTQQLTLFHKGTEHLGVPKELCICDGCFTKRLQWGLIKGTVVYQYPQDLAVSLRDY